MMLIIKKFGKRSLTYAAAICGVYIYFALLLYFTCRDILCFQESVSTFIMDGSWLRGFVAEPGGAARICALWLTQWFAGPAEAVFVGAALFTLISVLTLVIARRLGCSLWLLPLIVAPSSALVLMSCSIDYNLSGTVAYAFMLIGILPLTCIRSRVARLAASLIISPLVGWAAGSVVLLYSLIILNIEILRNVKSGWIFVLVPILACFLGWLAVDLGYYRDLTRAFLPFSYYTHWTSPCSSALLPWIMSVLAVNAAAFLRMLPMVHAGIYQAVLSACILAVVVSIGVRDNYDDELNAFARLSYLSGHCRWSDIEREYKSMPQDNVTLHNIVNMALAEKGLLDDVLFRHQNHGLLSLHNSDDKSPYTYMVLSDVYYSMGLVALAQRFAFEANEALGNYSPRMLKRLIDTNIITGQTEVARKYISLLEHTSRYKAWANKRREMADGISPLDDALAAKRACLSPDSRFAGYMGIDDDMLQALRANNAHTSTMQYLCAYYMLGKNVPRLIRVIDEFHGSPALRSPLPKHLQEAVAVDALINGSGIDIRYDVNPTVIQRCRAFWAEHQPQPNTFWHYLRNAKKAE